MGSLGSNEGYENGALIIGLVPLSCEIPESLLITLSLSCEDMARRWPSASHKKRPHVKLTMLAP